jgi:hypothetical protein
MFNPQEAWSCSFLATRVPAASRLDADAVGTPTSIATRVGDAPAAIGMPLDIAYQAGAPVRALTPTDR